MMESRSHAAGLNLQNGTHTHTTKLGISGLAAVQKKIP